MFFIFICMDSPIWCLNGRWTRKEWLSVHRTVEFWRNTFDLFVRFTLLVSETSDDNSVTAVVTHSKMISIKHNRKDLDRFPLIWPLCDRDLGFILLNLDIFQAYSTVQSQNQRTSKVLRDNYFNIFDGYLL